MKYLWLYFIWTFFPADVSKKARKAKKKARLSSKKDEKLLERREEPEQTEVYEISSGDDDCSRGMKSMQYCLFE